MSAMTKSMLVACGLCVLPMAAQAEHAHSLTAPIGIMGDHTHESGQWMASYKYSAMTMNGNRDGDNEVSEASVLSNFMVAPRSMTMQMHMLSLMYGVTDRLTLMGMASYVDKEMDHVTRMGAQFTTRANGAGDTKIGATYALTTPTHHGHHAHSDAMVHQWFLNVGLSLPTGSVDERDNTPAMANAKLPYPMQLGSGTYDPTIGVTYTGHQGIWAWGAQANATFRIGENNENYSLGNEYRTSVWAGAEVAPQWRLTGRLEGSSWGDIDGSDSDLNPMMVPTARTDLRSGRRLDVLAGLNYEPTALDGSRFGLEVGTPIYQHLDGPQLETDVRFMFTAQMQF